MEIFLWKIGSGMNFRISKLSDGNISWRIGSVMNFRISELSDGNIYLEDWYWYEL